MIKQSANAPLKINFLLKINAKSLILLGGLKA